MADDRPLDHPYSPAHMERPHDGSLPCLWYVGGPDWTPDATCGRPLAGHKDADLFLEIQERFPRGLSAHPTLGMTRAGLDGRTYWFDPRCMENGGYQTDHAACDGCACPHHER